LLTGLVSQVLADPVFAAFFIGCVLLIVAAMYVTPRFGLNKLRRVPALDAVDEIIRSCAERGKPVNFSPADTSLGWAVCNVPPTNSVLKYAATQCADLGVRMFSVSTKADMYLVSRDFMHQGYLESKHPERWNADDHIFVSGDSPGGARNIMEINEREGVGGAAYFYGICWSMYLGVLEHGISRGIIHLCSFYWTDDIAQALMFSDYTAVPEEHIAAGAYISKDPVDIASAIGMDFLKLAVIALIILLTLATALGLVKV